MSHSGYTGHLFEEEVLSVCPISRVEWNGTSYVSFRESCAMVRTHQPAALPIGARRLRNRVAEQIGTEGERVKLFTAVGTPLDLFHGVDAFFEFDGHVITIDLTINPHKDSGKAHFILTGDDITTNLPETAARIAREIISLSGRA
ncbi:hypothetical protein HQ403_01080 [Candidatus Kaiserbacteria bacterium]|nr:hypothetical protein [Candidatus Kaiserbacteria bacterium]